MLKLLPEGWTVVTKDKSSSAQWENTIAVTETGFEVTLFDRDRGMLQAA